MQPIAEIVLLAAPHDALFLSAILQRHAPQVQLGVVTTAAELEAWFDRPRPGARLIAYATEVIVPAALLRRLDGPAYNFHPGPPAYPGRHPAAFALYDGARQFGATAHVMDVRVDSGPIVGTILFDVPPEADQSWLGARSAWALAKLFVHMAPLLVAAAPLAHQGVAWGTRRSSNRSLQAMLELPPDIDAAELERRRRAFHTPGLPLRTTLHGRRFVLAD